jgi:phosphate transport system substrate-binding protein
MHTKKLNKSLFTLFILVVFVLVSIPGSLLAEGKTKMSAAGCKTEHFMLKDLSSAYKVKTGNTIRLGRTGNKKAVTMLMKGEIDFAYTCKPITQLSKKFKLDNTAISDWSSVPIGKDPIIVVSNYINGVEDISVADLKKLFSGNVNNWKELGGNDVPVKVGYLSEDIESGIVQLFKEFTVGSKGTLDPNATIVDDPVKIGRFVYSTPGGVSFMSLNSCKDKKSTILKVDGYEPTRENILNNNYRLSATYYITAPVKKDAMVADFINFTQSAEGQAVVSESFTPYTDKK